MGCMFCCMSQEQKVDRIMTKFKSKNISSLDRLEPSSFPQSFSGVVRSNGQVLQTALGGKDCVYHKVTCHEEVEKHRMVERDGHKHRETYYVWEHRFTQIESVDFILADPNNPNAKKVIVPIGNTKFVSHSKMDGFSESFKKGAVYPHHLNSFASRHKVYNTGHMRFNECSFDIGEALTMIGVVEEITLNGEICFNVKPCSNSGLTEDFFVKNEWDDWDKRSWEDLTKESAIMITDSPVKSDPKAVNNVMQPDQA